jgi:hypothetical protein
VVHTRAKFRNFKLSASEIKLEAGIDATRIIWVASTAWGSTQASSAPVLFCSRSRSTPAAPLPTPESIGACCGVRSRPCQPQGARCDSSSSFFSHLMRLAELGHLLGHLHAYVQRQLHRLTSHVDGHRHERHVAVRRRAPPHLRHLQNRYQEIQK